MYNNMHNAQGTEQEYWTFIEDP